MPEHIFKRKSDGSEHLFDVGFSKLKEAENFDDLGEGYLEKDPNTGINYAKLKKEKKVVEVKTEEVKPEAEEEEAPAKEKSKK